MNAETFEAWLEHHLLPTLEEGDIVVIDNLKPYLNTDFLQPIDFAGDLAKFAKTWHYTSENRIFALYIGVCAALAARFGC